MVYVITDLSENGVYGVCNPRFAAQQAIAVLSEMDSKLHFDYIECPINEIQFGEDSKFMV